MVALPNLCGSYECISTRTPTYVETKSLPRNIPRPRGLPIPDPTSLPWSQQVASVLQTSFALLPLGGLYPTRFNSKKEKILNFFPCFSFLLHCTAKWSQYLEPVVFLLLRGSFPLPERAVIASLRSGQLSCGEIPPTLIVWSPTVVPENTQIFAKFVV